MHELFSPQGSNPLTGVKLSNPRCAKVEFDRSVRSNVLVIEGDLTQSRVQIPKEDRPMNSLQLNHALVVLQILIPSSGQFLLELNVSNSPVTRMRLSAATFVSKADVVDAKGMAHAKIPLVIPRNCWVQIVFHVGGIFTHLFRLPSVKWIDSVVLAGSCKVRKVMTCADEAAAIDSKPGGMLLFAVPAYGPPVWQTAGGGGGGSGPPTKMLTSQNSSVSAAAAAAAAAAASGASLSAGPAPITERAKSEGSRTPPSETGDGPLTPMDSDRKGAPNSASGALGLATATSGGAPQQQLRLGQPEVSSRTVAATGALGPAKSTELHAAAFSPISIPAPNQNSHHQSSTTHDGGFSARFPSSQRASSSDSPVSAGASSPTTGGASSPVRMKFLRGEDGTVSFVAKNPEQEAIREAEERARQAGILERLRQEAEAIQRREEYERMRKLQEEREGLDCATYVRIVEQQESVNPLTGRRSTTVVASSAAAASQGGGASSSSATGAQQSSGVGSSGAVNNGGAGPGFTSAPASSSTSGSFGAPGGGSSSSTNTSGAQRKGSSVNVWGPNRGGGAGSSSSPSMVGGSSSNVHSGLLLDAGDGDVGSWDDGEETSIYSSMIAGGVFTAVVQTISAGGKPIVVSRGAATDGGVGFGTGVSSSTSSSTYATGMSSGANPSGGSGVFTGGTSAGAPPPPFRTGLNQKKVSGTGSGIPRRTGHSTTSSSTSGPTKAKKVSQPPSMMMLSMRTVPAECHPADDYDPELHRRGEPEIGYGCGFMEVIHGEEECEEEEE